MLFSEKSALKNLLFNTSQPFAFILILERFFILIFYKNNLLFVL